jgi:DNA-directed RNA polymerase specialized sigma24 family protein
MYNDTLEDDLKSYAKSRQPQLFNTRLYLPLVQLFKWICSQQRIVFTPSDLQDVQQLALLRVFKDIPKYDPTKGMSAFSFVRMIMTQEIILRKKRLHKWECRLEEYNGNEDARQYESQRITNHQRLLSDFQIHLGNKEKRICRVIRESLNAPEVIAMTKHQRIAYYASKAGTTHSLVKKTLNEIKEARLTDDN